MMDKSQSDWFWYDHNTTQTEIAEDDSFTPAKLSTYTDERGVMWQIPYDSGNGESLRIFDALMNGKVATLHIDRPISFTFVATLGNYAPYEYRRVSLHLHKGVDDKWVLTEFDAVAGSTTRKFSPAQTYEAFLCLVGYRYDFNGVVLE